MKTIRSFTAIALFLGMTLLFGKPAVPGIQKDGPFKATAKITHEGGPGHGQPQIRQMRRNTGILCVLQVSMATMPYQRPSISTDKLAGDQVFAGMHREINVTPIRIFMAREPMGSIMPRPLPAMMRIISRPALPQKALLCAEDTSGAFFMDVLGGRPVQ